MWAEDDRGEWFAVITNGQQGWQAAAPRLRMTPKPSAASIVAAAFGQRLHRLRIVCGARRRFTKQPSSQTGRWKEPRSFDQLCDGATGVLYGGLRLNSDVGLVHAQSVVPSSLTPTAGVRITLTANGSSATGPVDTGSWCWTSQTSQWTLAARGTAASGIIDWTPPAAGIYVVQLWIRRIGATAGSSPTSRVTRSSSGERFLAARALATAGARTTYRATRM